MYLILYTSRDVYSGLCLFLSIVYSVFQSCPTRDEIPFPVGQSNQCIYPTGSRRYSVVLNMCIRMYIYILCRCISNCHTIVASNLIMIVWYILVCSGRVSSSCSISGTRRFTLITNADRSWMKKDLHKTEHISGHLWHKYHDSLLTAREVYSLWGRVEKILFRPISEKQNSLSFNKIQSKTRHFE
jgi:hypothetical protein